MSGSTSFEQGTFDSASGLRPMSAYVMIAIVLVVSAIHLGDKALGGIPEEAEGRYGRTLDSEAAMPPYQVEDRNGVVLAASVPSYDLVASPRGLWQGHTPERILPGLVEAIASVSDREVDLEYLYASMLPTGDVDFMGAQDGWRVVNTWALNESEASRISEWIRLEQLNGWAVEPFRQLVVKRGLQVDPLAPEGYGTWRLLWKPRLALSLAERLRYKERRELKKDIGAAAWGSCLVRGLFHARRGPAVDGEPKQPKFDNVKDTRDVWAALMVPVNAIPLEQLTPAENGAIQAMLKKERVASHLVYLRPRYDRTHPAGEFTVLGNWGFTKDGQREEAPYVGLELTVARQLESSAPQWLEEHVATYVFAPNRVARRGGRPYFRDRTAGAPPVIVETTIDAHLQSFLGARLAEVLTEQRAALAMGVVVDVATGEVLAVDSTVAYPTRSFGPLNHLFTPGSTMKAVIMAMGLDAGVVTTNFTGFHPEDKGTTWFNVGKGYDPSKTGSGGINLGKRNIAEALGAPFGRQPLTALLAFSSNGGMAQLGIQIPSADFRTKLLDLGYGQKPRAGLGAESYYPLTTEKGWSLNYTQASMSFGNEILVSLWQHAEALSTVFRDGVRRPLTVLRSISQGDHSEAIVGEEVDFPRVFRSGVGREVRNMMGVGALEGTGRKIRRDDIDMGTKTGTTQKVTKAVVCAHLAMALDAEYAALGIVPKRAQMRADHQRLLVAPKPHAADMCYTSSVAAIGHLPDSVSGYEKEVLVLIVVDEPRVAKFGSQVAGPTAVAVLAEALGLTRNGDERPIVVSDEHGVITIEAGALGPLGLTPAASAPTSAQPWQEADL